MQLEKRLSSVRKRLKEQHIDALVTWKPVSTIYLSSFYALIYSRPVIVVFPGDSEPALIVPALDEEHARRESCIKDIRSYIEFQLDEPKESDPFQILMTILNERGLERKRIGIEEDYAPLAAIRKLQSLFPRMIMIDAGNIIQKLRMVKSGEEIQAIRSATELVNLGIMKTADAAHEGVTEIQLDVIGNNAILEMSGQKYPEEILRFAINMSPSGPYRSNLPHVFSTSRRIEKGDTVIHSRVVSLNGYHSECERTFIVGTPTKEQERIFKIVQDAQQMAIDAVKPGIKAEDLDAVARGVISAAGYGKYFIHRAGHGIGLEVHERPFLQGGESIILEPGMIFSVEPGVYIPQFGGVRHSDTVLVTENGHEILTRHPKDLPSLTILR
jgi:Xaa-Pro dipeptidase